MACQFRRVPKNTCVKRFLPLALLLLWVTGCTHIDPRADFLHVIERPRVALAPQIEKLSATNGIEQFDFSFASDAKNRVPGILMKPANSQGRLPVVITLHGTGGSTANMAALDANLRNADLSPWRLMRRITANENPAKAKLIMTMPSSARFTAAASIHFSMTRFGM